MKRVLILLLLCAAMLLCGCAEKAKVFSCMELQIELTNKFDKVEQTGVTAMWSTRRELVVLKRESFASLAELGLDESSTLSDYATAVIEANELKDTEITEREGLTCFYYEAEGKGKTYGYLATVHKSKDAFWLVQFAAKAEDYAELEAAFLTYAKSVRFS